MLEMNKFVFTVFLLASTRFDFVKLTTTVSKLPDSTVLTTVASASSVSQAATSSMLSTVASASSVSQAATSNTYTSATTASVSTNSVAISSESSATTNATGITTGSLTSVAQTSSGQTQTVLSILGIIFGISGLTVAIAGGFLICIRWCRSTPSKPPAISSSAASPQVSATKPKDDESAAAARDENKLVKPSEETKTEEPVSSLMPTHFIQPAFYRPSSIYQLQSFANFQTGWQTPGRPGSWVSARNYPINGGLYN